jgi:hypothetical protein
MANAAFGRADHKPQSGETAPGNTRCARPDKAVQHASPDAKMPDYNPAKKKSISQSTMKMQKAPRAPQIPAAPDAAPNAAHDRRPGMRHG